MASQDDRGDTVFESESIPKLYKKVLEFLHNDGRLETIELPLATGDKRYLIAGQPSHQRGNKFIKPIERKGYYMEANKNRDGGVRDLIKLLDQCGLSLQMLNK